LDEHHGGRAAVAAAVKVARAEAIAAAALQQRKALPAELSEERRKVRDDQGSKARGRSGQRNGGRAGGGVRGAGGPGTTADEGAAGGFAAETEGAGL
jgi:hypothetical protein